MEELVDRHWTCYRAVAMDTDGDPLLATHGLRDYIGQPRGCCRGQGLVRGVRGALSLPRAMPPA
jgi:hypothetical protein